MCAAKTDVHGAVAAGRSAAEEPVSTLRGWMEACRPGGMVFFGGAGVSTESGIPDFRSSGGIFMRDLGARAIADARAAGDEYRAQQLERLQLSPEQIVSRSFFDAFTREFYSFYCENMIFRDAQPNAAHRKLAEFEHRGILRAVVTQNIDGLHQAAGSSRVYELHGGVARNYCMRCGAFFSLEELLAARDTATDGIPHCEHCGGTLKPDVVLYEESLNDDVVAGAIDAIEHADLLVIAGTSLVVNPAASLIRYFRGSHLAIVNLSPTPADAQADLCIPARVGEVFDY